VPAASADGARVHKNLLSALLMAPLASAAASAVTITPDSPAASLTRQRLPLHHVNFANPAIDPERSARPGAGAASAGGRDSAVRGRARSAMPAALPPPSNGSPRAVGLQASEARKREEEAQVF
jgi:hypothetical protein